MRDSLAVARGGIGRRENAARVELVIAEILISRAMEIIRAALRDDVDDAGGGPSGLNTVLELMTRNSRTASWDGVSFCTPEAVEMLSAPSTATKL